MFSTYPDARYVPIAETITWFDRFFGLSGRGAFCTSAFVVIFAAMIQVPMSGEELSGRWRFDSGVEFPGPRGTLEQDGGVAVLK